MSTRAIIARPTEAGWEGVYHHSDGYPTGLGRKLHRMQREVFSGNAAALTGFVIDAHPGGWGSLGNGDPNHPDGVGYREYQNPFDMSAQPDEWRAHSERHFSIPACFCHSHRESDREICEGRELLTQADQSELWDIEYVYILDDSGLRIFESGREMRPIGFARWGQDMSDRDWSRIECGERYERCRHVATYHFDNIPEAYRSMSADELLGHRRVADRDAPEFRLPDGTVVRRGGSGHAEGYYIGMTGRDGRPLAAPGERRGGKRWFQELIWPDGTRRTVPLYHMTNKKLVAGITAVHAPVFTIDELSEKQ